MFGRINEQFEVFDCLLEVAMNNQVQKQRMQAPRIMIVQNFQSLVEQASNSSAPIMIKMSRNTPIYDEREGKWIDRENSIIFTNNAWVNQE